MIKANHVRQGEILTDISGEGMTIVSELLALIDSVIADVVVPEAREAFLSELPDFVRTYRDSIHGSASLDTSLLKE